MHERESEVAQSCLTLSDPMDCSLPSSSGHAFSYHAMLHFYIIASSYHIHSERHVVSHSLNTFFYFLEQLDGEGNGTPLQYPCLANPMDRGAW